MVDTKLPALLIDGWYKLCYYITRFVDLETYTFLLL